MDRYCQGKIPPHVDFLSCLPSSSCSYVWRSILRGRGVLRQGLGKCVKNGKTTKFWLDMWLPCGPLITLANRELPIDTASMWVSDYWSNNGCWRWDQFAGFLEKDVLELIQSYWVDPFRRVFVVAFFCKWRFYGEISIFSSDDSEGEKERWWKALWELTCAFKIKISVWKIFNTALPTAKWLCSRHILNSEICFRCSLVAEDICHALRDCPMSRLVWQEFIPCLPLINFFTLAHNDWLIQHLRRKLSFDGLPWNIVFVTTLWMLWYWRKMLLHGDDFHWPSNAKQLIMGKAKEIFEVLYVHNGKCKYEMQVNWVCPPVGFLKLNVDGCFHETNQQAAAAGLFRDEEGYWVGGFTY